MKTRKQMKDRLKWYVGRYIDFDGVYQAQCMDLTVDYMWWATDGKYRMKGNAIDAINTNLNQYGNYATIYKNTKDFLPKVGDIAVWTKEPAHPVYGHIGIVYGDISLQTCTMLDQNWNGNPSQGAKLRTDDYRGVTHFIRLNFEDDTKKDSTYTVKKGDTLYSISRAYDLTVDELKALNNLKSNIILPGDKLTVKKNEAKAVTPSKPKAKAKYDKYKTRGRSTKAYFKGTVDSLNAEIRRRSGNRKVGFNFNVTIPDGQGGNVYIPAGEEVYIFEVYGNFGRIYTGDRNQGTMSNRWVHLDRVNVTDIFK